MAEEGKLLRGVNLATQLARALRDAEELQRTPFKLRKPSYVSECKLASARITAIQRQMARKENASQQKLQDENTRLKQENAGLKLEIETLKRERERPVE